MGNEKDANTINSKIQESLIENWLPQLYNLKSQRKVKNNIMTLVILLCVIVVLALLVGMYFTGFNVIESVLVATFCSLSAAAFVYIGKLQACDDALVEIDFAVRLGNTDFLLKTISKISCYGSFQNLITEMGGIFKNGK